MNNITINNEIIKSLISKQQNQIVSGLNFKFLGKGSEGIIYLCENKVIKIYVQYDMNSVIKEFYIMGILKELDSINKNIIITDKYYLSLSNPVIIMEHMDGNLSEWCDMMINNTELSAQQLDNEWLSMIFQVVYGLLFLNRLNILHADTKSKNILYTFLPNKIEIKYVINGKMYNIPMNYVFKIADFGSAQILGSTLNRMSDREISEGIKNRSDLEELSRLIFRSVVNYAKNDYDIDYIRKIVDKDVGYKKYYESKKINIENELGHTHKKVRDVMLYRALLYYGIENGFIDQQEIIRKHALIIPSQKVIGILDKLTNLDSDQGNLFDLFDMFYVEPTDNNNNS
jgi:hypothetical protein